MPKSKAHRLPPVGARFAKIYRGRKLILEVIDVEGELRYRLGKFAFKTPSAASKYVTGSETNGWIFWGIEAVPKRGAQV